MCHEVMLRWTLQPLSLFACCSCCESAINKSGCIVLYAGDNKTTTLAHKGVYVVSQAIQGEVPSHLLRLKVAVEQCQIDVVLQECRSELDRELHLLSDSSTSEHVIEERRVSLERLRHHGGEPDSALRQRFPRSCPQTFFRERKPLVACEKRIRNMEDLCQKLPDNDAAYRRLDSTRRAVEDIAEHIRSTGVQLEKQPDKWKEWNDRCA